MSRETENHLSDELLNVTLPPAIKSTPPPSPCAWVAEALVDHTGREVAESGAAAVAIFAISVHQEYPAEIAMRTRLMLRVLSSFGVALPAHLASLWVFPAGYYGYDAVQNKWLKSDLRDVERSVVGAMASLPKRATCAFGADASGSDQRAWVYSRSENGNLDSRRIKRGNTDLASRVVQVGDLKASIFVCGEIVGNASQGPFCARQYLGDPAKQISDSQMLVDLSHRRVPKGWKAERVNPRWAHDARLRRFASRGVGVLAHHHGGVERFDCQSNWILGRSELPRYSARVTAVQ